MGVPPAVLVIPETERNGRVESNGKDFLQLDGGRFFLRALLPVQLASGHEYHFGVWTEVDKKTSQRAWDAWDEPDYRDLSFSGHLANSVPPWGDVVLDADVDLTVRNRDNLPYVTSSASPVVSRMLSEPWPDAECIEVIGPVWGDSAGA